MRLVLLLGLLCAAGVGCKSSDNFDPNYSTKINLTPEEKAKEQALMANQKAPGSVTPGQPIQPGAMKLPPGKGR